MAFETIVENVVLSILTLDTGEVSIAHFRSSLVVKEQNELPWGVSGAPPVVARIRDAVLAFNVL